MKPGPRVRAALSRIGTLADEDVDLVETALLLASVDRPRVRREAYRRHAQRLATAVAAYVGADSAGADVGLRGEALAQVLSRRFGYGGDTDEDDDPEDANLTWIIDRRRGVAAGLGILYLHTARACGWTADGIDFPARFLVRLEEGGRRVLLDPVDRGRRLAPEDLRALLKAAAGNHAELRRDHYRSLDNRGVLLRLQNGVKTRLLRQQRLDDALQAIRTMLLFAPDVPALWRESGLLSSKLGDVKGAVAALEEYMRRTSGEAARSRTSVLLQELHGRLS